ncbi:MAG: hypothetical protein ACJ76H_00575 [Bacteriovoracaceae bacterium]
MRFDVLFHFSSGPVHLVETKRLDLPASSGPEEIYQWTLIEDKIARPLTFQSMSLNPQKRLFSEGAIQFDLKSCTGQLFGKSLELTKQDSMRDSLKNIIESSLKAKGKVP